MKTVDQIREFLTDSLAKLRKTGIDQGEILYWETESGTLRTFLNRMGPSVTSRDADVYMTAIVGKKHGQAHTTDLSHEGLDRVIHNCYENAVYGNDSETVFCLPGTYKELPPFKKKIFFESTLDLSPEKNVDTLHKISEESKKNGLTCSARLMTGGARLGIANTSGTFLVTEYTEVSLSLILTGDNGVSAYASDASENIEFLDPGKVVQEAIQNAERQKLRPPVELDFSGKETFFDVILEPYAVAEWIEILASIGFNGLLFEEGESFLSGK
ncbi:MAG: hypothetical protein HYR79_06235 [Nitrospirae bacterium]|nr:hypothetical protein [Nitrospirota bacterium]